MEAELVEVTYEEKRLIHECLTTTELVGKALKYCKEGLVPYDSRVVGILGWYRRRGTLNKNQRDVLLHELSKLKVEDKDESRS